MTGFDMVYDNIDQQNYLIMGHFNGMLSLYAQLKKSDQVIYIKINLN